MGILPLTGRTRGMGILVEWASCPLQRVAPVEWGSGRGMGILVELASCQFQYIFARAGCPLYSYSKED
ncbi:MAG: hypothetical protein F6J90_38230 [Moorea sp. SIOASIH]|uniref:hypothetical protein n=1 Tax=Moorena sp. SIOASIH TaxID=2607817 RepID=UPI0013BA56F8|nr:hypothetical protein [Moorena sp. SIOASIH]NEO41851.1 hypothetical protein [Moorena sp. SIOASIH]NEO93335.1 hypothetical protein [Moorena sp. SIO3G5]